MQNHNIITPRYPQASRTKKPQAGYKNRDWTQVHMTLQSYQPLVTSAAGLLSSAAFHKVQEVQSQSAVDLCKYKKKTLVSLKIILKLAWLCSALNINTF